MLHRIIRWIIIVLFVSVPLVSWQGVFFPYTFIKTIVFSLLVELAFLLWVILMCFKPEYRPRISPLTIAISVFLVVLGIASFLGVDVSKSIWSDSERMFGFVTWLHLGALFLLLSATVRYEREWNMILHAVVGTAVIVAFYAIWQGFTTTDLAVSTIGNAAHLSSYLVPVFFLALLLLFQERRFGVLAGVYGISAFFIVSALPFTEARAGMVGLGGGVFISLIVFLFWGDNQGSVLSVPHTMLKRIAGVLLMLGVVSAGILFLAPAFSKMVVPAGFQALLDFDIAERTASGRLLVWRVAWEGWRDRFFFGWGPENFNILFTAHYIPELYQLEPWFDRAHNVVFDAGSTYGIIGLLAYVSMFGATLYVVMRRWKKGDMPFWSMNMLVAFLGAYFMQNMFTFDTLAPVLTVLFVMGYIVHKSHGTSGNVLEKSLAERSEGNPRAFFKHVPGGSCNLRLWVGVSATVFLAMGFVAYTVVFKPYLANAAAHKGWELLRTGAGDEAALAAFEKSISYGTHYSIDTRRFAAEYVFEFLKQGGERSGASLRRLLEYAIEKMDENIAVEPHHVKWIVYRGELYAIRAQKFDASFAKQAEQDFLRAKELSPGRLHIYLQLAGVRKMQGDSKTSWEYLDYVIKTAPEFLFGHLHALVLAIETGNREREEVEIVWFRAYDSFRYEAVRDAYYMQKRFLEAVNIQEELVERVESDPITFTSQRRAVYYKRLAALYEKAGEIEKARSAAMKVLELDPSQKREVEAFLKILE